MAPTLGLLQQRRQSHPPPWPIGAMWPDLPSPALTVSRQRSISSGDSAPPEALWLPFHHSRNLARLSFALTLLSVPLLQPGQRQSRSSINFRSQCCSLVSRSVDISPPPPCLVNSFFSVRTMIWNRCGERKFSAESPLRSGSKCSSYT